MAIRYERLGESPRYRDILIADTEVELLASVPSVEIAEGYAKDTGAKADWVQGIGWKVGGFKRVGDTLVSSEPIIDPQARDIAGARVDLLDEEDSYATWTGTYTGIGSGTITTTLPFVPDLVIVKGTTFGAQIWHRATKNTSSNNFDGSTSDGDYLTVSGKTISCAGASQLNATGIVYKIFAICDPYETVFSPRASAYSTQSMLLQNQNVSFALVKRDNTKSPFLLFGSSCKSFDNSVSIAGASISPDGTVVLPDDANVNTGENTSVLGFKSGRNLYVFKYDGDTSNAMPIYSPFVETECIMWFPLGASTQRASMFFPGLDASNMYSFQGQAVAALPATWVTNRVTLPAEQCDANLFSVC
jgi:hypothetical protein